MKKTTMLKKPVLDTNGALKFADSEKPKPMSGLIPNGDVRLTANIRQDLHLRLKIEAAHRRTTVGELIEEMIDKHTPRR